MAKAEANSKPVLAAEDVHIITVYVITLTLLEVDSRFYILVLINFLDLQVWQDLLPAV